MRLDFRMFRCLCWKTRPRNISNLIFYSTKPHWSEKGDATETWGLAEHFSCKGWEDEAWRTPWQSVAGADGSFLIAVVSVGVWKLFSDKSQKNHDRSDEAGLNLKPKTMMISPGFDTSHHLRVEASAEISPRLHRRLQGFTAPCHRRGFRTFGNASCEKHLNVKLRWILQTHQNEGLCSRRSSASWWIQSKPSWEPRRKGERNLKNV